jgi:rubrerythrin
MLIHFLTSGRFADIALGRSDPDSVPGTISRGGFFGRLALGLGGVSAGAAAARGLTTAAGSSSQSVHDREVLGFALQLEHLQAAFYAQALSAGKISGEAHQFAEVVGAEERGHLRYLEHLLGSGGGKQPRYNFGKRVTDQNTFLATAIELEEMGLAAYNGQAANLSPKRRGEVARVISVEARHAAWVRAIAGQRPAPAAFDLPISSAKAQAVLRRFTG